MASPRGSHAPGVPGDTPHTEIQEPANPANPANPSSISISTSTASTHTHTHTHPTLTIPQSPSPASPSSPDPARSPAETHSALPALPAPLIPPYWRSHARTASSTSAFSLGRPTPIRLEDNTGADEDAGIKSPLWARIVAIDGHVVVSGNMGGGIGDYVVWTCRVGTVDGGSVQLHKRYSEFEALRAELASTFPRAGSSLPVLPPKSVFYRFRPAFLEKRRAGLEYFLSCVLLNPEFASSAVLKEFVFR